MIEATDLRTLLEAPESATLVVAAGAATIDRQDRRTPGLEVTSRADLAAQVGTDPSDEELRQVASHLSAALAALGG